MSSSDERKFPSFLGIGAARSGTTWLHANLRPHPEIWLPPVKELHYFDLQRRGAAASYPVASTDVRLLGRPWAMGARGLGRLWRLQHSRQLLSRVLAGRAPFFWAMRYVFGFRTDRWYASLFRSDRVSGEITPGYMLLPRPVVEDIHKLNPDMKIILLLRNPVSRAWSSARKQLRKKVQTATDEEIRKMVDSPGSILRGDYVKAVSAWRGVFGADQVFIGFFDELVSAPRDLFRSILKFLGVDSSDRNIPATVEKVVPAGSGPKRELPESLLPHMYAVYLDQLRELEKMLDGPVSKWLAKAEEAVAQSSSAAGGVAASSTPQLLNPTMN